MSFIKYDNFRGEYKLSVQSIDEMAAKVEDFLYSLGTERANVLGIRLSIEEALLRWYDHFKAKGEEPKVRFYTGKSFFRPVINITLKGESIDPFDGTDDENSSGDWVGTMMANIGLSPRYTYENGINILHLRLSRPQINPGIGLLIGIAAGIIIGLSTRFLLGEADIEMLVEICKQNTVFYEYTEARPTKENILDDMKATPPGIDMQDKYYFGFFDGRELVAIMDLIDGYPKAEIAYIGFFMMNPQYQGKQIGTAIIDEVIDYLLSTGKTSVRLAIDKGNPQSTHFWKKNGFDVLSEADVNGWTKLVAERKLP